MIDIQAPTNLWLVLILGIVTNAIYAFAQLVVPWSFARLRLSSSVLREWQESRLAKELSTYESEATLVAHENRWRLKGFSSSGQALLFIAGSFAIPFLIRSFDFHPESSLPRAMAIGSAIFGIFGLLNWLGAFYCFRRAGTLSKLVDDVRSGKRCFDSMRRSDASDHIEKAA
jgi:hypothetical protein